MVNAGMDIKALQYIMGHSEIDVTLNIYTHMNYDRAAAHMIELVDGRKNLEEQEDAAVWSILYAEYRSR